MKLFFLAHDSLYKIFSTIEKVSVGQTVTIHIHGESDFFVHVRWAHQCLSLIATKKLKATFLADTQMQANYFESVGAPYIYAVVPRWRLRTTMVYRAFFNVKKLHLSLLQQKKYNYTFFLIFGIEAVVVILLCVAFVWVIVPQTTISIKPSYVDNTIVYNLRYTPDIQSTGEHLAVSYSTGNIDVTYSLYAPIASGQIISYLPAQGRVLVINTLPTPFLLKAGTTFMTDEGLLYASKSALTLPAAVGKVPSKQEVILVAKRIDMHDVGIGERGNIAQDKRLYIAKIPQSRYAQALYAQAIQTFAGGRTIIQTGTASTVSGVDLSLSGSMYQQLYKGLTDSKISLLRESGIPGSDSILLSFPSLITTTGCRAGVSTKHTDTYMMICTLSYKTVLKQAIYTVAQKYFAERLSPIHTITQIDLETISMNKPLSDPFNPSITIPTRIQSTLTYDFAVDRNGLIPLIQYRSAGQTQKGISAVLDSIPEVGSYTIAIRPFWSDTATSVLSRIGVEVK